MSVPDYTNLSRNFFTSNHNRFDLATNEGCGKYTEAFVEYARKLDSKIGHLKKNPSQTQYNGHANDAVLYPTGVFNGHEEIYHAVDIIARAEQPHPWKSEEPNNPNAKDDPEGQWSEDKVTEYHSKDWLAEPGSNPVPGPKMVPYKSYEGDTYWHDKVGKALYWDYTGKTHDDKPTSDNRAGRIGLDSMSAIWIARTIHDIKMEGLDPQQSLDKHRAEWCAGLQIPVIPIPPEVLA